METPPSSDAHSSNPMHQHHQINHHHPHTSVSISELDPKYPTENDKHHNHYNQMNNGSNGHVGTTNVNGGVNSMDTTDDHRSSKLMSVRALCSDEGEQQSQQITNGVSNHQQGYQNGHSGMINGSNGHVEEENMSMDMDVDNAQGEESWNAVDRDVRDAAEALDGLRNGLFHSINSNNDYI